MPFYASGVVSLHYLANAPRGAGRPVDWEAYDVRHELIQYLLGPVGLSEYAATRAASVLLLWYAGVAIDWDVLRDWWRSNPGRQTSE
jgi:hypothetical protein